MQLQLHKSDEAAPISGVPTVALPSLEFAAGEEASLATILEAWNDATIRLQRTHEILQAEVARLSDELEAKNRELERQNRLADLGRMAAHVAHEVRNSLSPVSLYLSLLRRRLADAGSLDILAKVEAGFRALDATVNDLLNFTSHREPQWRSFIISDLLEQVLESLAPQLEAQGIDLDVDVPPHTVVTADREMMRRAILNLLLNAVDAMPKGGELVITSFQRRNGGFELEIADSGPGLTEEQLTRAFDPFFTTKATGTGLGLSIVQRIAEAHGGRVTATNCPQGGAAFTIELPPRRAMGVAA